MKPILTKPFKNISLIKTILNTIVYWLKTIYKIRIFLLTIIASNKLIIAQEIQQHDYFQNNHIRYENYVYKKNIKSVLLYKDGWVLSYPIIKLNSEEKIKLSFDDIDGDIKNYYYTVVHCNADWTPSKLLASDYISGFYDEQIFEYKRSFNTICNYTHYNVVIPNENMQLKLSGNYIIMIYEDANRENVVITYRFVVVEKLIGVDAVVKQPVLNEYRRTHHEIDVTLDVAGVNISDPFNEIKLIITQNNRWDNAITNLKPLFIKSGIISYDYNEGNLFSAGSEFRYFDIKSIRFYSDRIKTIELKKHYEIYLTTDELKTYQLYYYHTDLNGKYFPEIQEGDDTENQPDYVYVHFTLPFETPLVDGSVYIFGGLSNWEFSPEYRMNYNYEKKAYTLSLLLKQGYYNYVYALVKDGTNYADNTYFEGSHYETENDYVIYVYWFDKKLNYYRAAGYNIINSLRK